MNLRQRIIIYCISGLALAFTLDQIVLPGWHYSQMEREFVSKQEYAKMDKGIRAGKQYMLEHVEAYTQDHNNLLSKMFNPYHRACKMYLKENSQSQ